MKFLFNLLYFIVFILCFNIVKCTKPPHIVMIVGDDMGWNDVGLHGSSQIPTPNIDALGYNGAVIKYHYTLHICTPSRAALLTGKHAIKTGLQGFPISAGEPRSLPISAPTLPEQLKKLGYKTHMVGKWHLGSENRSVTPNGRGFETHLGYWAGFVGYFDYRTYENVFDGYDLHENYSPAIKPNLSGIYATELFTNRATEIIKNHNKNKPMFLMINHLAAHTGKNGSELEVPDIDAAMKKYDYIVEPQRRLFAEVVNRLDTSIGKVVKSLDERKMLDNTIIIFMSDNGAQTVGLYHNSGSNWPYRGLKLTLYEGGVRNTAVIWSKKLNRRQYIEKNLIHITDWMPTLYSAAGGNVKDLGKIDGVNQWPLLKSGKPTRRTEDILINIDEVEGIEALLSKKDNGRYKLLKGSFQNGIYDNYYGDSGRNDQDPEYDMDSILDSDVNRAISKLYRHRKLNKSKIMALRDELEVHQSGGARTNISCDDYCLFDLRKDPTETTNIAHLHPDMLNQLIISVDNYRKELIPQTNTKVDPKSNPNQCCDTWFPWLDPVIKCDIPRNDTCFAKLA